MPVTDYYVLFFDHTSGIALYRYVRGRGIKARISPSPRSANISCGMSLLVEEADIEAVRACVRESGIEIDRILALSRQINPKRDRYC